MPTLKYKTFEHNSPDCDSVAVHVAQQSQVKHQRAAFIPKTNLSLPTGRSRNCTVNNPGSEFSTANHQKIFSDARPKTIESNVTPAYSEKEWVFLANCTFPRLLMRTLSDKNAMEGIDWLLDGKTIAIVDRDHMESYVLPRLFHDISYENFIRLINCWGFTKIEDDMCKYELFRHELFQKDFPDLCNSMKATHWEKSLHLHGDCPSKTSSSNHHSAGSKKKKNIHIDKSTQKLVAEILTDMSNQQTSMNSAEDKSYSHSEHLEGECRSGTYLSSRSPSASIEQKNDISGKTEKSNLTEVKLREKNLANIKCQKGSMDSEKDRIYHYPDPSKKDLQSEEQRYKTLENVSDSDSPFGSPHEIESQGKDQRAKNVSLPTRKSCEYTVNKKGSEILTSYHQKVSSFGRSKTIKSDTMSPFTLKELAYLTKGTFPRLLMRILSDKEAMQGIDWVLDGKTIAILDHCHLVSRVLPRFFKDLSYEKFIRLFELWGFTKIEDNTRKYEMFRHELFQKDYPDLCKKMRVTNYEKALQLQSNRFSKKSSSNKSSSNYHSAGSKKHTDEPAQNSAKDEIYDYSQPLHDERQSRIDLSSRSPSDSIEQKIVSHGDTEESILAEVKLLEKKLMNLKSRKRSVNAMMGKMYHNSEPLKEEYQSEAHLSSRKVPCVDRGRSISGTQKFFNRIETVGHNSNVSHNRLLKIPNNLSEDLWYRSHKTIKRSSIKHNSLINHHKRIFLENQAKYAEDRHGMNSNHLSNTQLDSSMYQVSTGIKKENTHKLSSEANYHAIAHPVQSFKVRSWR